MLVFTCGTDEMGGRLSPRNELGPRTAAERPRQGRDQHRPHDGADEAAWTQVESVACDQTCDEPTNERAEQPSNEREPPVDLAPSSSQEELSHPPCGEPEHDDGEDQHGVRLPRRRATTKCARRTKIATGPGSASSSRRTPLR